MISIHETPRAHKQLLMRFVILLIKVVKSINPKTFDPHKKLATLRFATHCTHIVLIGQSSDLTDL